MKWKTLIATVLIGFMPLLQAEHSFERESDGSIHVHLHLPSLADGPDSELVTEFLFRSAFFVIPPEKREGVTLLLSEEGTSACEFRGSEEKLSEFFAIFCQEADQILENGMTNEQFDQVRSAYLQELKSRGALIQADQVERVTWDEIRACKAAFHPVLRSMGQLFEGVERLSDWKDLVDRNRALCPFERTELHDAVLKTELVNQPGDPQYHLYYQLRLTHEDCRNIDSLIEHLSMPWYNLMRKASKVNRLGDAVRPVHPLRFMGYILSQHKLKKKLKKDIKGSSLVWGKFVAGFGDRMAREKAHGTLYQYVPGFCQHLGASEALVYQRINSHEWEKLIKDLLH